MERTEIASPLFGIDYIVIPIPFPIVIPGIIPTIVTLTIPIVMPMFVQPKIPSEETPCDTKLEETPPEKPIPDSATEAKAAAIPAQEEPAQEPAIPAAEEPRPAESDLQEEPAQEPVAPPEQETTEEVTEREPSAEQVHLQNDIPSVETPPTEQLPKQESNLAETEQIINAPDFPVKIVDVDKVAESVKLQNVSTEPVDLTGWRMVSIRSNRPHPGIEGKLDVGQTKGFANLGKKIWRSTLHNDGALYDKDGQLVSYWNDPTEKNRRGE